MARVAVPELTTPAENPGPWGAWLYGDYGTGKSVLAAGFPNPIYIDTEKSRRSFLNHPELVGLPVFPCEGRDTFDKVRAVVDRIILANDSPNKVEPDLQVIRSCETVIVDTWSTLQMKELNSQMKEVGTKQGRHPDLPSEAEFNINNTRLRKVLIDLLEMSGKNVVILSHVKEEKDDDGNTIVIRPFNSPSITGTIASLVDGIFYLTSKTDSKGETTRKLQCMPSNKIRAKNRFSAYLNKEVVNPTALDIMRAIEEQQAQALLYLKQQKKEEVQNA